MQNTTQDLLKYVDRGERIIARLTPRVQLPRYIDSPCTSAAEKREFRRVCDNLCRLAEWAKLLPGAEEHHLHLDRHLNRVDGTWIILEPGAGEPLAAHWAQLANQLEMAAERGRLDDARYYLKRMRVLATRGEGYSPHLTWEELAAELLAIGIVLPDQTGGE